MSEKTNLPIMLSLKECASVTGISYGCLRQWCLQGKVAHIRSGKKFLINYQALIARLNSEGVSNNGEN